MPKENEQWIHLAAGPLGYSGFTFQLHKNPSKVSEFKLEFFRDGKATTTLNYMELLELIWTLRQLTSEVVS